MFASIVKILVPFIMEGIKLFLEERRKSRKGEISRTDGELVDELSNRVRKKKGYADALRRADDTRPDELHRDS